MRTTMITLAAFLFTVSAVQADELGCIGGREKAAGKYGYCQAKGKVTFLTDSVKSDIDAGVCRVKYAATYPKLQVKNPGTTCDAARYVDNLDGTVTDHLTGLVWEKKTNSDSVPNLADRHDADNLYTWTDGDADVTDPDGTVFSDFLTNLNAGAGFAGATGWRLPTMEELQTILLPEAYPCTTNPCTDPTFGPDAGSFLFSATPYAFSPLNAWLMDSTDGTVGVSAKNFPRSVRAVRNGL